MWKSVSFAALVVLTVITAAPFLWFAPVYLWDLVTLGSKRGYPLAEASMGLGFGWLCCTFVPNLLTIWLWYAYFAPAQGEFVSVDSPRRRVSRILISLILFVFISLATWATLLVVFFGNSTAYWPEFACAPIAIGIAGYVCRGMTVRRWTHSIDEYLWTCPSNETSVGGP